MDGLQLWALRKWVQQSICQEVLSQVRSQADSQPRVGVSGADLHIRWGPDHRVQHTSYNNTEPHLQNTSKILSNLGPSWPVSEARASLQMG